MQLQTNNWKVKRSADYGDGGKKQETLYVTCVTVPFIQINNFSKAVMYKKFVFNYKNKNLQWQKTHTHELAQTQENTHKKNNSPKLGSAFNKAKLYHTLPARKGFKKKLKANKK